MLACLDLNFRNDNYHLRKGIEKLQKEKTDVGHGGTAHQVHTVKPSFNNQEMQFFRQVQSRGGGRFIIQGERGERGAKEEETRF